MNNIREQLFNLNNEQYKKFSEKIINTKYDNNIQYPNLIRNIEFVLIYSFAVIKAFSIFLLIILRLLTIESTMLQQSIYSI